MICRINLFPSNQYVVSHIFAMFCFLQGHSAPILYAAWCEAGLFPESELMQLRKIDNDLEGHPTPVSIFLWKNLVLVEALLKYILYIPLYLS